MCKSIVLYKVFSLYLLNKQKQNDIMQSYIDQIIATGLKNGLTLEQIANNPEKAMKANLKAQLNAIEKAGSEISLSGLLS